METTDKTKSKGLGDTIAKVTNKLSIDKLVEEVTQKVGKQDCGCKRRQEKLNDMFPYKGK